MEEILLKNSSCTKSALIILILGGAAPVFFSGCERGPSNKELLQQYKPRLMELRAMLKQIAAKIPDRASELAPGQPLDPLPEYAHQSREIANTEILM